MAMKNLIATSIWLLVTLTGMAQDSTKVRFFVRGSDVYYVELDGKLLPLGNVHTVSRGSHHVRIWSPKYEVFTGKLETGNLDSTNYVAIMKVSPLFTDYIAEREVYKRKVFYMRTAPVFVAGVSAAALPFLYYWRRAKHEELVREQFYARYNSAQRSSADEKNTQYVVRSGLFYTALGGAIAGTGIYLLLRNRVKALNEPVFRQQNPFTLEYFELSLNHYTKSPQIGLGLAF